MRKYRIVEWFGQFKVEAATTDLWWELNILGSGASDKLPIHLYATIEEAKEAIATFKRCVDKNNVVWTEDKE